MSTTMYGIPNNASIRPTVLVSNITAATPGVITTSTPHGAQTGDWLVMRSCSDPALQGLDFKAGTVTTNTVQMIDVFGVPITTTVAGATGTLWSYAFANTITIPTDGDAPTASSINTPLEALADQVAFLGATKANRSNGHLGSMTVDPQSQILWTALATAVFQATSVLNMQTGSFHYGLGRKTRRPRAVLLDSNNAINTTLADEFELASPTANRTLTLTSTGVNAPMEGETMWLIVPSFSPGFTWSVVREDAAVICTLSSPATFTCSVAASFHFSSTAWRLSMNSGSIFTWNGSANIQSGVVRGSAA